MTQQMILVVDDEATVRFTLDEVLSDAGHTVRTVSAGEEALGELEWADVVVTDLAMPGMDGMALLRHIASAHPELPVVMLTARGSERAAVEAMRAGAYDYLTKPFDIAELRATIARAVEVVGLRDRNQRLEAERRVGRPMLGESAPMQHLNRVIQRVAKRDITVLVRGETGTGKELVASLLHASSARRDAPLVRFNCAAIPEALAEAELFGHVKGAFTGATAARPGFFRQAHGGTLVLDEIGELSLGVQATLLRALQEGEIQAVGAGRVERVDVRVIACSNRALDEEVAASRFRADLYYRLAVVELEVPPLRARAEDIPLLVEAFRRRYCERFGVEVAFTPALFDALRARSWPGNVRELENAVARLVALSDGPRVDAPALGAPLAAAEQAEQREECSYRSEMRAFERGLLERALSRAGGNQSEAARLLDISRSTLIDKLKRHELV